MVVPRTARRRVQLGAVRHAGAGAKGIEFEFGKGPKPGGPLWDPGYLDPVFLEKLDHFLAAMARRYDGNPNVAFIDIGSFGMWGEGHTGFSSRLNEEQTLAVVKRHVDLHVKHFKRTLLCISDDVAGAGKRGGPSGSSFYANIVNSNSTPVLGYGIT